MGGNKIYYFLLATAALLLQACDPTGQKTLPEEEYNRLGRTIAASFNSGDSKSVTRKFLQEPVYTDLLQTLDSLGLDDEKYDERARFTKKMIADRFEEQTTWIASSLRGDNVQFIAYRTGPEPYLLFGINLGDYLDFMELRVMPMGESIYITDLYRYYSGVRFSDYIIWSEVNEEYYGRKGGPYQDALGELYNASVYLEKGQPGRALIAYNRIPDEFAYHPRFHGLKQEIAQYAGDSILEQTLFEKIGYHWDSRKTRYANLIAYYRQFNLPDTSLLYVDSLEALTGQNYLTDTLRQRILGDIESIR